MWENEWCEWRLKGKQREEDQGADGRTHLIGSWGQESAWGMCIGPKQIDEAHQPQQPCIKMGQAEEEEEL